MAEIYAVMDGRREAADAERRARYETAAMTAIFVGHVLSGSALPDFDEIYKSPDEESNENQWIVMKERLLDFAEGRNRQNGINNI